MRLLVVFAHPSTESFGHAIFQRAVETLKSQGHELEVLDLYRMGFDPLLSTEEWHSYLSDTQRNIANVKEHVEKLQWAEGLVFVFPTFFFGVPAMLKGWLERVWLPGVTFDVAEAKHKRTVGKLKNIRTVTVITTCGAPKWWIWMIRDPIKNLFKRGVRP